MIKHRSVPINEIFAGWDNADYPALDEDDKMQCPYITVNGRHPVMACPWTACSICRTRTLFPVELSPDEWLRLKGGLNDV